MPITKQRTPRYLLIDQIRGLAVLLMIIFHFAYNLNAFNYVNISFSHDRFWFIFPRVIVFLFFIAMGLSFPLAHSPKIKWPSLGKRMLKLTILAALISISTYFMFPKQWVYFGTLHSIAVCSIMALPFLNHPKTSLFVGIGLLIPVIFFNFKYPWFSMAHKSMDYIPAIPWIAVVLLGIFASHKGWYKVNLPDIFLFRWLIPLGKHALIIYVLHQPILYGLTFSFHYLLS